MILIDGFLSQAKRDELSQVLSQVPFHPGQNSAGVAGALIKNNVQADPRHPGYAKARDLILQAMQANTTLANYAVPIRITPINFAQYGPGMTYGDHVDAAIHTLPNMTIRTDLSFTIFLAGPDEYEGGELVMDVMGFEKVLKCNAGDMVLYPTGVTHRVNPVSRGTRRVAIGWIQSLVPNHEHREILYKLHLARADLLKGSGRTPTFELVNGVYENLLRMYSQP